MLGTRNLRIDANTRIILTFVWIATSDVRTLLNIETPNSVKAYGKLLRLLQFAVAKCDRKLYNSSSVNWNIKSAGNREALRLTCSFRRFVAIPYSTAMSASKITWTPLISCILSSIDWNSSPSPEYRAVIASLFISQYNCFDEATHPKQKKS